MSTGQRFTKFLDNIALTDGQIDAGKGRRESVVEKLNIKYWSSTSKTDNSKYVGSWGKFTRIRPPRDVDVLFQLPYEVYTRFEKRTGNKQSQILQEVRDCLSASFKNTVIRGDGPVVIVPFTSYNVELIPAFSLKNGQYWICMTQDGGRYKSADYDAEATRIATSEAANGNTRHLIRMMKCWQAYCSVPMKSFWMEILAVDFLATWQYAGKSSVYYDYMTRDFLNYIIGRKNSYLFAPGTSEMIALGEQWLSRAESALARARKACQYEADNMPYSATDEWRKIFGTDFPYDD